MTNQPLRATTRRRLLLALVALAALALLGGCGTGPSVIAKYGRIRVDFVGAPVTPLLTWSVDDQPTTYRPGVTIVVEPGEHTVNFGPLAGYTPPAAQTVTVQRGRLVQVTGRYVKR